MAVYLDTEITYRLGKHEDIQQLFEITYAEGWAVSYKLVESFFLSCPQAFFAADDGNRTIGRAKSSRLRYIWLSNLIHEEFLIFSHKIVWY